MQKARIPKRDTGLHLLLAESWGFEPQIPFAGYTRLAGEHLRPLGQLSGTVLRMIPQKHRSVQAKYFRFTTKCYAATLHARQNTPEA